MEYRPLGASGLKVPILSFGSATFGGGNGFFKAWGSTQVDEATRMLNLCLDIGVNLFDSADVYSGGISKKILGKAIEGKREELLLSTKGMGKNRGTGGHQLAVTASYGVQYHYWSAQRRKDNRKFRICRLEPYP